MAKSYRTKFFVSMVALATVLVFHVSPVLATCSTSSTSYGGRHTFCTTCCTAGRCHTTCH
jgi:hypothetical protein